MRRLAVLTSGGDAPGMNAAIRAVVRRALANKDVRVFGVERGFAGLMEGKLTELRSNSVADIIHRGGTILHTARSEEFKTELGQEMAVHTLARFGIEGLIVIGGDGSFRGAQALAKRGIKVIGVPGTIDNDVSCTDATIGFDTAVNTVLDAINRVRDTAISHGRVFVIEVMGRDKGFIALASGLAGGAESILVPEVPFDLDEVAARVRRSRNRGKRHSIIVCAEGAARAFDVARGIEERTGLETRVTVLGYIQRGGTPSAIDRALGTMLGAKAVDGLLSGYSGVMAGVSGGRPVLVPFETVFSTEKGIDLEQYELAMALGI